MNDLYEPNADLVALDSFSADVWRRAAENPVISLFKRFEMPGNVCVLPDGELIAHKITLITAYLLDLIADIIAEMEGENWNKNDFLYVISHYHLTAPPLVALLPQLHSPLEQYVVIGLLGLMWDDCAYWPLRRVLAGPDDKRTHVPLHHAAAWALYNINRSRLVAECYWWQWAVNKLYLIPIAPVQLALF